MSFACATRLILLTLCRARVVFTLFPILATVAPNLTVGRKYIYFTKFEINCSGVDSRDQ